MAFTIRPYHPSDLVALYRVCLQTGDSGKDARHLCRDEELLGHCYVAPYAVLEPDLCFVLLDDGAPCGYVLGTRDSPAFRIQTEQEWCVRQFKGLVVGSPKSYVFLIPYYLQLCALR